MNQFCLKKCHHQYADNPFFKRTVCSDYVQNPLGLVFIGVVKSKLKSTLEAVYLAKSLILAASILIPGPIVVDMAMLFR